jgi:DNA ligase-1
MTWQPLRAYKENFDPHKVRFPLYVSPKYDGIQAIVTEKQQLVSRRLRLISNDFCRRRFEDARLIGCQGELVAGPPTSPDVLSRTQTAVMSKDAIDKHLAFYVFDWYMRRDKPYRQAIEYLLYSLEIPMHVFVVRQVLVKTPAQLMAYEEKQLALGFEGIMARSPDAPYKEGRSGLEEQILLKRKPFEDREYRIVEVEEMMHNDNEATVDARGYTKRSKRKEGMRPAGMFGRALVEDLETKVQSYVGSGPYLTLQRRIELWKPHIRRKLPGTIWKCRSQTTGVKDKPRNLRVLSPRSKDDL